MIPNKLSKIADQAGSRYNNLTLAWQALYGLQISSPNFGHAGQSDRMIKEAYAIAQDYLDLEADVIARDLKEIAVEAHQTLHEKIASIASDNLEDAALAHLSETESYLRDEIIAQIHRDIALLRVSLQRAMLEVRTIARAGRLSERKALIEYRIGNTDMLDFVFMDRRSRRTPSRTFIRALWRQTALAVYNEVVLLTLSDHGIERAAIMHLEEGIMVQVDAISLDGSGDLPGYGEVRNTYFHPNANAYLDLENVYVSA
jgi:hypothetical protein